MTDPSGRPRNGRSRGRISRAGATLIGLLLLAAGLRLWHLGFGLPSLNDPDEPLFVMKALDMLRGHTIDPGWFGHPATTLFYALAAIFALVAATGIAAGWWTSTGFAAAVFADPGLLIVPGRLLMVACGLACVYLTWSIGKRAAGPRIGLIAAALLAVNPLHIELSQIIRSDMMATAFMLLSTRFAVLVFEHGRRRDIVLAGVAAGLACATKWPAAIAFGNVECAILWLAARDRRRLLDLPLAPVAAAVTLIIVSPFLVIDHAIVVRDLLGEARPYHLGSTGGGFAANLRFYLTNVLGGSFGPICVGLAAIGCVASARRFPALAVAVLPVGVAFLVSISAQSLLWERWAVPVLPFVALAAAVGIDRVAALLPRRLERGAIIAITAVSCVLMVYWNGARTRERATDTRQIATAWLAAHVDPQRSVLIEHAAFDLIGRPGRLLFPMGRAGCVDIRAMLARKPSYAKVETARAGSAIVDVGNVAPELLASCRADYAVFTHYARYQAERTRFPVQVDAYRRLARGGTVRAIVSPIPGERGGPMVYVVQMAPGD